MNVARYLMMLLIATIMTACLPLRSSKGEATNSDSGNPGTGGNANSAGNFGGTTGPTLIEGMGGNDSSNMPTDMSMGGTVAINTSLNDVSLQLIKTTNMPCKSDSCSIRFVKGCGNGEIVKIYQNGNDYHLSLSLQQEGGDDITGEHYDVFLDPVAIRSNSSWTGEVHILGVTCDQGNIILQFNENSLIHFQYGSLFTAEADSPTLEGNFIVSTNENINTANWSVNLNTLHSAIAHSVAFFNEDQRYLQYDQKFSSHRANEILLPQQDELENVQRYIRLKSQLLVYGDLQNIPYLKLFNQSSDGEDNRTAQNAADAPDMMINDFDVDASVALDSALGEATLTLDLGIENNGQMADQGLANDGQSSSQDNQNDPSTSNEIRNKTVSYSLQKSIQLPDSLLTTDSNRPIQIFANQSYVIWWKENESGTGISIWYSNTEKQGSGDDQTISALSRVKPLTSIEGTKLVALLDDFVVYLKPSDRDDIALIGIYDLKNQLEVPLIEENISVISLMDQKKFPAIQTEYIDKEKYLFLEESNQKYYIYYLSVSNETSTLQKRQFADRSGN